MKISNIKDSIHEELPRGKNFSRRGFLKVTWWFTLSTAAILGWCSERRDIIQDEASANIPADNFNLHHTPARITFSYTDDGIKTKHHPARYIVNLDFNWLNISTNNKEIYDYIESQQEEWASIRIYMETIGTEYFKTDSEWVETLLDVKDATSHKLTFDDINKTITF